VAREQPGARHGDRHSPQPPQPYSAFFQAVTREGRAAADPLSRSAPHLRHHPALKRRIREVCPGVARALHHSDHPRHLLPLTPRYGRRDRRSYGRRAALIPIAAKAPGTVASALIMLAFYLQISGKLEWRDPDSNRGYHDFQLLSPAAVRIAVRSRIRQASLGNL
jgi:hypothetical protein